MERLHEEDGDIETLLRLCNIEDIEQLSLLTRLYLQNNGLVVLPESISNLSSLTEFDLSRNRLVSIPDSIGQLSSLFWLGLSWNQLTTIPESIGNLSSLTVLDLSWNQLTTIPESIGNLSLLITLSLSRNQLTTIPESIRNLRSLNYLNLSGNQFTTIPESIVTLPLSLELYYNGSKQKMKDLRDRYLTFGWTPKKHCFYPKEYRVMATTLLLLWDRDVEDDPSENPFSKQWFPRELVHLIITSLEYNHW